MKILRKFFNRKKTVKMNIYNMKLHCPYCSCDNLSLFQLQIHICEKHPDKELFKQ